MKLRQYQSDLIDDVRTRLQSTGSCVMQAPTGAGKTATVAWMVARAAERGRRTVFLAHRQELLDQSSEAFWQQDIPHGVIQGGRTHTEQPIQVASVQTLARRLNRTRAPDLLIIDEAHRAAAASYRKIIEAWPNAYRIGLTATPQRTDGAGLSDLFSSLATGPSVRELIEAGYLSDYRLFGPPQAVSMDGVHSRGGDYVRSEAEAVLDKPTITGDAVDHYLRLCPGRRAIVFCVSRAHASHVADQFRNAGVAAAAVTGANTRQERNSRLAAFRSGDLHVLVGVDLFVEGLDVPAVEAAILLRPTQSLIVHLQAIGRALRPHPGKSDALILDHVGNTWRHGLPDDDRDWTLEGRKRRARKGDGDDVAVTQCKRCFAFHRPKPTCPYCGTQSEVRERTLEQQEGELQEIDEAAKRRESRREVAQAKSLEDLKAVAKRRGYHPKWAEHVWRARQNKRTA